MRMGMFGYVDGVSFLEPGSSTAQMFAAQVRVMEDRIQRSSGILGPDCDLLTFEGRGVVTSGTGALASLRGNFDFTFDAYSGTLH